MRSVFAHPEIRTHLSKGLGFSKEDRDLRALLRANETDDEIVEWVRDVVNEKEEGHRINEPGFVPPLRTMVFIGG